MSKRVSVVLPDDLGTILEEMAKQERRSHSQMGAILIEEAIKARGIQQEEPAEAPDNKPPAKQEKKPRMMGLGEFFKLAEQNDQEEEGEGKP